MAMAKKNACGCDACQAACGEVRDGECLPHRHNLILLVATALLVELCPANLRLCSIRSVTLCAKAGVGKKSLALLMTKMAQFWAPFFWSVAHEQRRVCWRAVSCSNQSVAQEQCSDKNYPDPSPPTYRALARRL
jgi:hypothetical protein